MAVLSNYITLTKDGWSEPLPPYATGLILVAKANGTATFTIDIQMGHDSDVSFDTYKWNVLSDISNSGAAYKYYRVEHTVDTLPYLGYEMDSGTEPEYVRMYFNVSKR